MPPGRSRAVVHPLDQTDVDRRATVALRSTGPYLEVCDLLGVRTAQLHQALAAPTDDPAFGSEDLSLLDQRSLHQAMRSSAARTLGPLRRRIGDLPARRRRAARPCWPSEADLLDRFKPFREQPPRWPPLRIHGDYHLGQVLFTGRDVVFLDFEGEPLQSIYGASTAAVAAPRRGRDDPLVPLRDPRRAPTEEDRGLLTRGTEPARRAEAWAGAWYGWAAGRFLRGYLREADGADFLPTDPASLRLLLDAFVLEKAFYELSYELGNRPDWSWIPLVGLLDILATGPGQQ